MTQESDKALIERLHERARGDALDQGMAWRPNKEISPAATLCGQAAARLESLTAPPSISAPAGERETVHVAVFWAEDGHTALAIDDDFVGDEIRSGVSYRAVSVDVPKGALADIISAPPPSPEVASEGAWRLVLETLPPPDLQVLVELREGIGTVCDVACYVGRQDDGEDRWILADVRLDSRQIKRWAHIYPEPPKDAIAKAVAEAIADLANRGETA